MSSVRRHSGSRTLKPVQDGADAVPSGLTRAGGGIPPGVADGAYPQASTHAEQPDAQLPLLAGQSAPAQCTCTPGAHPHTQRTLPTATHLVPYLHPTPPSGEARRVWTSHSPVPTIEPRTSRWSIRHRQPIALPSRSRLPIGSELGSVAVLFAVMSESETVVRGTNVRCSTCRHIQWVPVDKTAFACERCDAQLTRR